LQELWLYISQSIPHSFNQSSGPFQMDVREDACKHPGCQYNGGHNVLKVKA
jgi:hypothetical protein